MATDHWAKGVDGSFSDNSKWSTGVAPGMFDNAMLDADGNYTVTASGAEDVNSIEINSGVTLFLSQNTTFEAFSGVVNGGAIQIGQLANLEVAGAVDNSGFIAFNAAGVHPAQLSLLADATLSGNGRILFNTTNNGNVITKVNTVSTAVTLTNQDNTILGCGTISNLTFVNDFTVNGNNTTGAMELLNDVVTNSGTIEATAKGGMAIMSSSVTNTGSIEATTSANLSISNSTVTGGKIAASALFATVSLGNSNLIGCNLSIAIGATLQVAGGPRSTISGGAFTNAGKVMIGDQATLAFQGTINNAGGQIDINAGPLGATLLLAGAATVNGGLVKLINSNSTPMLQGATPAVLLTNHSTIEGSGSLSSLTLFNAANGIVDANGDSLLTIAPGGPAVTSDGVLEATGPGTLVLTKTTVNSKGWVQAFAGGKINLSNSTVFGAAGSKVTIGAAGSHIMLNSGGITGTGTLTIDGGILSADTGANVIGLAGFANNKGTVDIADAASLSVKGAIANSGTISLNGSSNGAQLLLGAGATLSGGGTVLLHGGQDAIGAVGSKFWLTNVDNTISGQGTINSGLANQAQGVVSTSQFSLQIAGPVTNAGHINAIGAGIITLHGVTTNKGVLQALGAGVLNISDTTVTNAGGTVLAGDGARVTFDQAHIFSGSIAVISGGTLAINGPSSIVGASLSNAVGGTVNVNQQLTLGGAVTNAGTFSINGGVLALSGATTLSGGGTVSLTSAAATITSTGNTARTFTNVDNTISGFGNIGAGLLSLVNQSEGLINANAASFMTIATGFTGSPGNLRNAGRIEATGAGGLTIQDTDIQNSGGSITAIGSGGLDLVRVKSSSGVITAEAGALIYLDTTAITGGTVSVAADGTLEADGMGSSITGATFINAGKIDIDDDGGLDVGGTLNNGGVVNVGDLATFAVDETGLSLTGDGTVTLDGGVIAADTPGAVLHNVNNTISGTGYIGTANGFFGDLSLNNDGVIDATSMDIDTGSLSIVNAGTIEQTGAGHTTTIASAISNSGKLIVSAGTLTVKSQVSGDGSVEIAGGEAIFVDALHQDVAFTAGAGKLDLEQSQFFTGSISGFSTAGGASLDLGDIGFVSANEATFADGVLTVSDGTHTAEIKLVGDFSKSAFVASSDGNGGTLIVDPTAHKAVASFVAAMASFDGGGDAGQFPIAPWRPIHPSMLAHASAGRA